MGVCIFLDILPHNIDKKDWENVYEESLALINAYPFMESVVDKETYGVPWKYVQRPKESALNFRNNDSCLGWHVFGDYSTMLGAESFILFKDLDEYRSATYRQDGSDDILAEYINRKMEFDEEFQKLPVAGTTVFDGKTQGYPHHIYLLAIACLIESRFPKEAYVWGDISIAQMEKAVEWANTILQHPIQMPERLDHHILMKRLRRIIQDDLDVLKSFMAITISKEDIKLGDFIRDQFDLTTITAYFTEEFKGHQVKTLGFHDRLIDYLNLGFTIESACDICVINVDGCRYDPENFVDTVLSLTWAEEDDDLNSGIPLSYNDPDSAYPETVHSQFGKVVLTMAGFRKSVNLTKADEEVVVALREKLGGIVDIESCVQDVVNREDEDFLELQTMLEDKFKNIVEDEGETPTYTIDDLDDLILWEEGDTIHPVIERLFKRIKEVFSKHKSEKIDIFTVFNTLTEREKIENLIRAHRYFYIKKEVWNYYFENINDTNLIYAVHSIFQVKAEELNTNKLCKALVNNVDLLKKYIVQ